MSKIFQQPWHIIIEKGISSIYLKFFLQAIGSVNPLPWIFQVMETKHLDRFKCDLSYKQTNVQAGSEQFKPYEIFQYTWIIWHYFEASVNPFKVTCKHQAFPLCTVSHPKVGIGPFGIPPELYSPKFHCLHLTVSMGHHGLLGAGGVERGTQTPASRFCGAACFETPWALPFLLQSFQRTFSRKPLSVKFSSWQITGTTSQADIGWVGGRDAWTHTSRFQGLSAQGLLELLWPLINTIP